MLQTGRLKKVPLLDLNIRLRNYPEKRLKDKFAVFVVEESGSARVDYA